MDERSLHDINPWFFFHIWKWICFTTCFQLQNNYVYGLYLEQKYSFGIVNTDDQELWIPGVRGNIEEKAV